MPDFYQSEQITTLHDLGSISHEHLETMLLRATREHKLGLVLPVTASDMRAAPFAHIVDQLARVDYIEQIVVVLGVAPEERDYREAKATIASLGERADVLWTDGERVQQLYADLGEAAFDLSVPGKGRSGGCFIMSSRLQRLGPPQIRAYLTSCSIKSRSKMRRSRQTPCRRRQAG